MVGIGCNAMAFIPCPFYAEVVLRALLFDQQCVNVWNFKHPDGVTSARLKGLTEDVADWWVSEVRQWIHQDVEVQFFVGRDLTTKDSYIYEDTRYSGQHGAWTAGTCLPGGTAFCVSHRTDHTGRIHRGRTYLFGISNSNVEDNNVKTTFLNGVVAAFGELIYPSDYLGVNWRWQVLSRYYNKAPRSFGVGVDITSVIAVDNHLDSMRSRLTGKQH
jgi:hypothetical protein